MKATDQREWVVKVCDECHGIVGLYWLTYPQGGCRCERPTTSHEVVLVKAKVRAKP